MNTEERLHKATTCMAPPEPDLLAATRALKPVLDAPAPVDPTDVGASVRTAAVFAEYALAGQHFLDWHEQGNITLVQQHSPWEKHLRKQVAHYHEAAAFSAVGLLSRCYGREMFDRLEAGAFITPDELRFPGAGDTVILACFARAAVLGANDYLTMLLGVPADSDRGRSIQIFVSEAKPIAARRSPDGSSDTDEAIAWQVARLGARVAIEIVGAIS